MSCKKIEIITTENALQKTISQDPHIAYAETYTRNFPLINQAHQNLLKDIKIAVAGCGSTGGAFLDGAIRLGVVNFNIADNGSYDYSNLNRQMVTTDEINQNKAYVYSEKMKCVYQNTNINTWTEGISDSILPEFLDSVDFLFDAVDVTTYEGMRMKLRLHAVASELKIPTGSSLDLGFTQRLQSYNYHLGETVLHGKYHKAVKSSHPLKSLIEGFIDVGELSYEVSEEAIRLIQDPNSHACQLGSACFLLSSMVTPYLIHFIVHKKLPPKISINLLDFFNESFQIENRDLLTQKSHEKLKKLLEQLQ